MLALDLSKYTGRVTDDVVNKWCTLGVELLIIQAHPAGWGQERSLELMAVASAHRCFRHPNGMPWDAYIYQYMGIPDWQTGALLTLDIAAGKGLTPRELWLDVEDVDTEKGWPYEWRIEAVYRDLALCDAWAEAHGCPRTGIYTALWYWPVKMATTEFSDRELWDADYDGVADAGLGWTPYGGWARREIKQFQGTSVLVVGGLDLNALSEEEMGELDMAGLPPVPEEYLANGWTDWRIVAINLQGVCDAMGHELDELRDSPFARRVYELEGKLGQIRELAS